MFDFLGVKGQVQKLATQLKKLREDIEQLQREREDVVNAPATKDDVKAQVKAWIAAQAAEYNAGFAGQLAALSCNALVPGHAVAINLASTSNSIFGPMLFNRALCGLLGPALYESMASSIDAMTWPAGSLPMEGRAASVERIDKKLGALIDQQRALVFSARDAGLQVEGA